MRTCRRTRCDEQTRDHAAHYQHGEVNQAENAPFNLEMMSYCSYDDIMRAVIDTNILVEGLNRKGPSGRVVDAWAAGRFIVCVSTAMALEYEAVLSRHGSVERTDKVLKALQALLSRAEFVPILFSYRPISPDPGDDMVIDCAMNAHAAIVTSNQKDFQEASKKLGFELFSPETFVDKLKEEKEKWPD